MNENKTFYEEMKANMVTYKTETLGITEKGKRTAREKGTENKIVLEYEHILPSRLRTQNLWSGIRETAVDYFRSNKIKWHDQRDNLLSSQIMCVNVFSPLQNRPSLLDSLLRKFYPSLDKVTSVDFEYIGPKNYLNEPGGRGYNRTSVDVAITWNDAEGKNNLLLIEFKFTERNFGGCGRSKNTNPDRCYHGEKVICSPKTECYRASPKVNRPYWDMILSPQGPFRVEMLRKTRYCPFKYDFYQLMRNQLLAKCIGEDKDSGFHIVEFAVCYDDRNKTLLTLSRPVDGNSNPLIVWKAFLKNTNSFKYFTIQELLEHIDLENLPEELKSWRAYLDERYELKRHARSF